MASSIVKRFNQIIDANLEITLLENEITKHDCLFEQPKKTLKISHASELTQNLVIDKILEECPDKSDFALNLKQFLHDQFIKIVTLHQNGCNYSIEKNKVITFVKTLLSRQSLTLPQLTDVIAKEHIEFFPIDLVWYLSKLQVISIEQVVKRCEDVGDISHLLEGVLSLIIKRTEDDVAVNILTDFYCVCITISYELSGEFEALRKTSNRILSEILSKFLEHFPTESEDTTVGNELDRVVDFINIFDLLLQENQLSPESVRLFLSNQLIHILTFRPEVQLSFVVQQQSTWRSTHSSKVLTSILFSIIKGLGHDETFKIMDNVVSSLEVNWAHILTFISVVLLSDERSSLKLKEIIDSYMKRGCTMYEEDYLILGFLFARHASIEGRHVFPSYPHWFAATFGSERASPATNKQSFSFLFNFLSGLVPYESVCELRAHIQHSVFVPKGCQSILRDYQHLSKVRLQDLTSEPTPGGSSGVHQLEIQQNKTAAEISSAICAFEESGKVPSFMLETSIFRKHHYLTLLLPSLLISRHLPDPPDTRMKLIEALHAMGKIPAKMYKSYLDECQKIDEDPSSVIAENIIETKTVKTPVKSVKDIVKSFVDSTLRPETEKTSTGLVLLSRLTEDVERLTKETDKAFANSSVLVISSSKYNPQTITYQIVDQILEGVARLVEVSETEGARKGVAQLIALFATSPSLQNAFITTALHTVLYPAKGKEPTKKKVKLLGSLICELMSLDGLFLPVRLCDSAQNSSVNPAHLLLQSLPSSEGIKSLYFTCCVLNSVLSNCDDKSGDKAAIKDLCNRYCCIASRLCVVNLKDEGVEDVSYVQIAPHLYKVPFVTGSHVPHCCHRLVMDYFNELSRVPCETWVKFELETPWGGTPFDVRLRHLHFWFRFNFGEREGNLLTATKDDHTFLLLFWSLVRSGMNKSNAADIFILLQSLSFSDPGSISLLEEWMQWKKRFLGEGNDDQSESCSPAYHSKFVVFHRLCHALPPALFTGRKSSVTTLSLFSKYIQDILEIEGDIFLSAEDVVFLVTCFLEACQWMTPSPAHVQHCFAPLKDSVLFHLLAVRPVLTKHPSLVEKYHCFEALIKIETKDYTTFESLPAREAAIMSAFITSRTYCPRIVLSNFPQQARSFAILFAAAILGIRQLKGLKRSTNWVSAVDATSSSEEDKITPRMTKWAASLLILLIHSGSVDPIKWMSDWKADAESTPAPIFPRVFSFGMIYLLSTSLSSDGGIGVEDEDIVKPQFLSLLLLAFASLVKYFEKQPNCDNPTLSMLSRLNCTIHSIIEGMERKHLERVPDSVLRVCDKDLAVAVRQNV